MFVCLWANTSGFYATRWFKLMVVYDGQPFTSNRIIEFILKGKYCREYWRYWFDSWGEDSLCMLNTGH